jgi:CheY-like chemotaxis protein
MVAHWVLVYSENEESRRLLAAIVQKVAPDFAWRGARCEIDASEQLKRMDPPSAVILDGSGDEQSLTQMLDYLRGRPDTADVPIAVIGLANAETAQALYCQGANLVLHGARGPASTPFLQACSILPLWLPVQRTAA